MNRITISQGGFAVSRISCATATLLSLCVLWGTGADRLRAESVAGVRPEGFKETREVRGAPRAVSPVITEVGKISLSVDGVGSSSGTGTVQVEKPAGATVRRAIVCAASTGFSNVQLVNGDVNIDGVDVAWDTVVASSIRSSNAISDVTTLVKSKIDSASAGRIDFTITEARSSLVEGEILAVIFDDPNQATNNTVVLLFGAQLVAGDTFAIGLADPINTSDPNVKLELSIGISFGSQCSSQFSQVDVNGQRLTTFAGGQDDGASAGGALITVGGLDDSTANPPDPLSSACTNGARTDDELYNLLPFVVNGDTSITVFTKNPSTDDNIFFASLFLGSTTAVVGEGIILAPVSATNPLETSHTVTATVQDSQGNAIVGRTVTFNITSGPHVGKTGTDQTDSQGKARFTYTGTSPGTDVIEASFVNNQSQTVTSNQVTKEWSGLDQEAPKVSGCSASDQNGIVVQFSENVKQSEAENKSNTVLYHPETSSSPMDLTNATLTYSTLNNTLTIGGLFLYPGRTFKVTCTNIHDIAGNLIDPTGSSCTDTVAAVFTRNLSAGFNLFSVPYDVGGVVPATLFGVPATSLKLAVYDGSAKQYQILDGGSPVLALGNGYWVKLSQSNFYAVGHGTAPDPAHPFEIAAGEGWFQIGNPWLADLPWKLDTIAVLKDGNQVSTLAQEANKDIGSRLCEMYCYRFDPAKNAYQLVFDPSFAVGPVPDLTDHLGVGEGAFMFFHQPGLSISVPGVPPATSASSRSSSTQPTRRRGTGWAVELQARSGNSSDGGVFIGQAQGSRGGGFQTIKPPRAMTTQNPVELYLMRSDSNLPLGVDLQTTSTSSVWRLAVRTAIPGDVTLSWPSLGAAPRNLRFTLVDEATGRRQAMRTTTAYPLRTDASGAPRFFHIEVSDAETSRLRISNLNVLSASTRASSGLSVMFSLSHEAQVQLRLRAANGRVAAATPAQVIAKQGLNLLSLPTTDRNGRRLPRGTYLVELVATTSELQQVRSVRTVTLK